MQNGVIIYMSCLRDVPLLLRSLILLGKNFIHSREYPIVVFHDDISKAVQSTIRVQLHSALGFIPKINFEILEFKQPYDLDASKFDPNIPIQEFWMGYRHMCRFHSGEIYKDPRLLKYDWYWRLDSDSYMLSPINYDPFEYMAKNGYEYAYMCDEDGEVPRVADGLWEATKEFLDINKIPISDNLSERLVNGRWNYELYYTNFEIAKFSFFRSENYQKYYNHLDSTKNFYYKRWGDAPIHWLGVKMFLDKSKVWAVKDICYQHNNWVKNLNAVPNKIFDPYMLSIVDGTEERGRKSRLLYAMNRYKNGGPDGVNWGD